MNRSCTGVILAGGTSSRMGTDKALLKLNGIPFIAHVAATLEGVFDRVLLAANDPDAYHFLGLEVVPDIYQDVGPMGGIHSGLVHAGEADIFVCACDTPLVTRELVKYVATFPSTAPAAVAFFNQRLHPLFGLYRQMCLPRVVEHLKSRQLRVLDFLNNVKAEKIPITPDLPFYRFDMLSNFNTPEDLTSNDKKRTGFGPPTHEV
jgi:molybdenum cofactor guanylyltransferase